MNGPEFEIPQWSEYQEARIEEENEVRAGCSERAAEVNLRGCNPECNKRWYDNQPIEIKIEIQRQNVRVAKLLGYGHSVHHFQAKLIALMEEQNGESRTNENAVLPKIENGSGLSGAAIPESLSER